RRTRDAVRAPARGSRASPTPLGGTRPRPGCAAGCRLESGQMPARQPWGVLSCVSCSPGRTPLSADPSSMPGAVRALPFRDPDRTPERPSCVAHVADVHFGLELHDEITAGAPNSVPGQPAAFGRTAIALISIR